MTLSTTMIAIEYHCHTTMIASEYHYQTTMITIHYHCLTITTCRTHIYFITKFTVSSN